MKRVLVTFVIAAAIFEIIAQLAVGYATPGWEWVLNILVILGVLYLLVRGLIGWVREVRRDLPQVQKGVVVRRRHWHFP